MRCISTAPSAAVAGFPVKRKKVQRLMQQTGITALYPKANTSRPGKGYKISPYLVKNLSIVAMKTAGFTTSGLVLMVDKEGFVQEKSPQEYHMTNLMMRSMMDAYMIRLPYNCK